MPFDIGGFLFDTNAIRSDKSIGIVEDSLILHLDPDNSDSFAGHSSVGYTCYDLSGNSYNATGTNNPIFAIEDRTTIGDTNLVYTLVDHSSSHPTDYAGLTAIFTNGTNVATGTHTTTLAWGNASQTIRWGGTVGSYPSYHTRTVNYGWKVEGWIYLPETGTYAFHIDGDDAMDFSINGTVCAYWYGGHGFNYQSAGGTGTSQTFDRGWYPFEARMEEVSGGDGIAVGWRLPSTGGSSYVTIPTTAFSTVPPCQMAETGVWILGKNNTSSHFTIPHNSTLTTTGDMTAEAWINITDDSRAWTRIFGKGSHPNRTFGLWYHGTNHTFLYQRYGASNANAQVNSSWSVNNWYHVVGTSIGTTHTLYINGSQSAQVTASSSFYSDTNDSVICGGSDSGNATHRGMLGAIRQYNRGLSASEVAANYNAEKHKYGLL